MDNWRTSILTETSKTNTGLQYKPDRSLWLGGMIVFSIIFLGVFGPSLAPRDPLKENFIVFINDTAFVKPPFPAFSVPGFPLGSDEFGRDVFSRLLWAIRPTLTLVLVVASIRLILGTVVGLIAGWSTRAFGKIFDAAISLALSLPVLFVALFVIAALGQQAGIWAFIIGLVITGWADAARLVREQTRQVRSQLFIEASSALGASHPQIILGHVLPQIVPMIWVLLSFEASGALMVTAELGVLGYFIHAIWIPIGDWVGLRTSGAPELGEMLSNLQQQPWGALAAGGIIFLTVLGLNLVGDSLRNQGRKDGRARKQQDTIRNATTWIEEMVYNPASSFRRQLPTIAVVVFLAVAAVAGTYGLVKTQERQNEPQAIALPGGNLWSTTNRDSQGTRFSPDKGPQSGTVAWTYSYSSGFSGGPVVAADGTLYLPSLDRKLHAISPQGKLLWMANLPDEPVGSPALGITGRVFITDQHGGLTTVYPNGSVVETVPGGANPALAGPVIAADDAVYYTTSEEMIAVSADGTLKWRVPIPTYSISSPNPRLSADDRYYIFEDYLINTSDGSLAATPSLDPLDKIIVGIDRNMYRISTSSLKELDPTLTKGASPKTIQWDARALGANFRYPVDGGTVPDGKIWAAFGNLYEYARMVWLDPSGALISATDYPFPGLLFRLAGIDSQNTFYSCGSYDPVAIMSNQKEPMACQANRVGANTPLWRLPLNAEGVPAGAALLPGRLYMATSAGTLFCITDP